MKRIFFVIALAFLCAAFLCSFSPVGCKYENISLQNNDKKAVFKYETASSENDIKESIDKRLEDIFSDFKDFVPDGVPTDIDDLAGTVGIKEVIDYITSLLHDGTGAVRDFCLFIGIALLFCLAEILSDDMGESAASVRSGVALVLSVPMLHTAGELIASVGRSIADGAEFFGEIIPILSSVAALGTGGLTAGCATATMSFSLSFVSEILVKNLFPAAALIFVASMLSGIDTGQGISSLAKGIRGWFNFLIGLTSLLIAATLGAQTLITASRDSLAIRGAKYAISGMIPVVGGTVSGALTMLISGVKLLSGSIGVISVAALLSFMGAPLIKLLFYKLCLGACVILTSFSGASFGERFFNSLKGAVDCLIAVLTSSLMVFILEIIILTASLNNIM